MRVPLRVGSTIRKQPVDGTGLPQIGQDEGGRWRHGRPMAGGEVINNGGAEAKATEQPGGMAPDEAGASRDQDGLDRIDRLTLHHPTPVCGDAEDGSPGVVSPRLSC